jgi:uncharacterized protein (DUF302 family)
VSVKGLLHCGLLPGRFKELLSRNASGQRLAPGTFRAILKIDSFSQVGPALSAHRDADRARENGGTAIGIPQVVVRKAERMPDSDYVEHKSNLTFLETVNHLTETIEKVGMNVFASIDHAAGAKEVGMNLPPTVVLIYGHARGGTPVMQAAPGAALDLPLRVLIRETDRGETMIAFHPARQMLARYAISGELVDRLAKAQQMLVGAIQAAPGNG